MSDDPVTRQYIENFRKGLAGLPDDERGELVSEIENHIAEAGLRGESTSEVLDRLGPADRLARPIVRSC